MEWNGKAKEKEEGTIVEVLHVVPTDPPGAPKQKTYLVWYALRKTLFSVCFCYLLEEVGGYVGTTLLLLCKRMKFVSLWRCGKTWEQRLAWTIPIDPRTASLLGWRCVTWMMMTTTTLRRMKHSEQRQNGTVIRPFQVSHRSQSHALDVSNYLQVCTVQRILAKRFNNSHRACRRRWQEEWLDCEESCGSVFHHACECALSCTHLTTHTEEIWMWLSFVFCDQLQNSKCGCGKCNGHKPKLLTFSHNFEKSFWWFQNFVFSDTQKFQIFICCAMTKWMHMLKNEWIHGKIAHKTNQRLWHATFENWTHNPAHSIQKSKFLAARRVGWIDWWHSANPDPRQICVQIWFKCKCSNCSEVPVSVWICWQILSKCCVPALILHQKLMNDETVEHLGTLTGTRGNLGALAGTWWFILFTMWMCSSLHGACQEPSKNCMTALFMKPFQFPLLVTFGHFWSLSDIFGHFRTVSFVSTLFVHNGFEQFWLLWNNFGHFQSALNIFRAKVQCECLTVKST